ncbi:hypothetical protein BHM03_00050828 [Ensete ventricosum]|nr:hypothetical protein BHM03_00050828 [Ensete ventricosum]
MLIPTGTNAHASLFFLHVIAPLPAALVVELPIDLGKEKKKKKEEEEEEEVEEKKAAKQPLPPPPSPHPTPPLHTDAPPLHFGGSFLRHMHHTQIRSSSPISKNHSSPSSPTLPFFPSSFAHTTFSARDEKADRAPCPALPSLYNLCFRSSGSCTSQKIKYSNATLSSPLRTDSFRYV